VWKLSRGNEHKDISHLPGVLLVWPAKDTEAFLVADNGLAATAMYKDRQVRRAGVRCVHIGLHTFFSHSMSSAARCSKTALRILVLIEADGPLPHF
jgi:hypothetical protein